MDGWRRLIRPGWFWFSLTMVLLIINAAVLAGSVYEHHFEQGVIVNGHKLDCAYQMVANRQTWICQGPKR